MCRNKEKLASFGCVDVTKGGDFGGLGVIPQQAFFTGKKKKKIVNMYMVALLASKIVIIIYVIGTTNG